MIQRIQTIFLLLAAAACFSLWAAPFATTPADVAGNPVFADSRYSVQDNLFLILAFALAGLLAVISIFLFRNRHLQMRLTILSTVAIVVGIALTLIFFLNNSQELQDVPVNDGIGAYLPFAGILFILLAYRYIGKDEKLVRSMDRLR